jgi:hypothetical protein
MLFAPIRVISRPKKNGLGTHFGVQFPDGTVYDYTYQDDFRRVTEAAFADGEPVTMVREIPWHLSHFVRHRLAQLARNPRKYDVLAWNCETFAEWLTSGVARSAQITGILALLGVALTMAFIARA